MSVECGESKGISRYNFISAPSQKQESLLFFYRVNTGLYRDTLIDGRWILKSFFLQAYFRPESEINIPGIRSISSHDVCLRTALPCSFTSPCIRARGAWRPLNARLLFLCDLGEFHTAYLRICYSTNSLSRSATREKRSVYRPTSDLRIKSIAFYGKFQYSRKRIFKSDCYIPVPWYLGLQFYRVTLCDRYLNSSRSDLHKYSQKAIHV